MYDIETFELPKWIENHKGDSSIVLAGSATPALSLDDLVSISSDPEITSRNLRLESVKLSLGAFQGEEPLRRAIADLYDDSIKSEDVLITNGTTGANWLIFQSMIKPGDHVVAMYPAYTQLLSIPKAIVGDNISYWKTDVNHHREPDLEELKSLIQPATKMIVINNPNNPLGTVLSLQVQKDIIALAREKGVVLLVDEIFRPLFHGDFHPPSFAELAGPDDKIVVTGSLSKSWGLTGTRIGWLATQNKQIFTRCSNLVFYTFTAVGALEQVVATEAMSERCRSYILSKHLALAKENLAVLDKFVSDHPHQASCIRPQAGATAFLRLYSNGVPVDDVAICTKLKNEKGVLLAPGSLCFGLGSEDDFRGFVRIHLTGDPEKLRLGLEALRDVMGVI